LQAHKILTQSQLAKEPKMPTHRPTHPSGRNSYDLDFKHRQNALH